MWGRSGVVRYLAALMLLFGLLATSLSQAAAQGATPVPDDTSEVTLNVSSSEGILADIMPEGSTWSISGTSGEGVIASGEFSSDQLELPTSVVVDTPIPYGDYLVTVAATWAFEPYEHVHTIDSPTQTLDIVLDPYVEQPVQTTLNLVPDDGVERDVTIDFEIWDAETDEMLVSDTVDLTVPGAFWQDFLDPGDYWVNINAGANYLGISEGFSVTPRVPTENFTFTLIEIPVDPTETPTAEPTHDDKHDGDKDHKHKDHKHKKDKEKEVTTLPSTGQGSDSDSSGGLMALTLGGLSLLLMAAGFAWRQRRTEV